MTQEIIEKPMSAECTMKQYEAIPDADFVENREYQLTDYPDNGANVEQMAYALTCQRLFPAGTVVTFSGTTDSNYTNGHLYQIQVDDSGTKSWKDITPVSEQSIARLVGTRDKPIDLIDIRDKYNGAAIISGCYYKGSTIYEIPSRYNILVVHFETVDFDRADFISYFYSLSRNSWQSNIFKFAYYIASKVIDYEVLFTSRITVNNINSDNFNIYAPMSAGANRQICIFDSGLRRPTWSDPATLGLATTADIEAAIGNVSALLGDTSDLEV